MEDADMTGEGEEQQQPKSEKIATALSTLASVASILSARSRAIPSNTDFHFYNNFPEFKSPARQATAMAAPAIAAVASAPVLRLRNGPFPSKDDSVDDLLDYVVNLNDELLERFGASMDEFKLERTKEEENAKKSVVTGQDGFQLVVSKNNKKKSSKQESSPSSNNQATGVSVASKDKRTNGTKPKVPFHIPSIPRPQDEYRIIVNNTNTPFQHVWLEQNGEESLVHPLEKLSVLDFMDKKESEPIKPAPIESTPFKLVETLDDLKAMVAKLKNVSEFAVDLEHNSYRSYQGLTCLMQISTRTEDFIVDTLKVRIFLGSYMRDLFKDPTKRKVMHGADHDIMWLQRDFGIYVCNLFDTGQASRVLELERNSLEFLLHHFCDVTANKEYQNADWRLRPLPAEMVKYAKEDTHYLLYIYDLMRNRLISESTNETDLLLEVYNRSKEICLQMYEKELLTDTSFLSIYGVQQAELNARQLAIVSGLYQWRDIVARNEDESTGYVLPNKTLIEIAKEMPVTSDKLLKFVKSRHSYIERNIPSILEIIRNSISQAHAFEPIALQLKINQIGKAKAKEEMENVEQKCPVVQIAPQKPPSFRMTHPVTNSNNINNVINNINNVEVESSPSQKKQGLNIGAAPFNHTLTLNQGSKKAVASVQITKKPAAAFGALFGKASTVKRPGSVTISTPFNQKQEESKNKLEKIKQTVALPFYFGTPSNINNNSNSNNLSFSNEIIMQSAPVPSEPEKMQVEEPVINNTTTTKMEDIILLEAEKEDASHSSDKEESVKHKEWLPHPSKTNGSDSDSDSETDPTQLSSSFEKCFKSVNEFRNNNNCKASTQTVPTLQLKPFDYSAARNAVFHSGKKNNDDGDNEEGGNEEGRKSNKTKRSKKERGGEKGEKGEKEKGFQQARRRQAFPMSGNRSTTYF